MEWSELMECQLYGGSEEDTNNTKKIRVLSTDSHKWINFMIRRELNIAETEAETRLWVKSIHNGCILSLGNIWNDLIWQGICNPCNPEKFSFLIEIKNRDGTWPSKVGYFQDRRSASSSQSSEGEIGEIEEMLKQKKKEHLDIENSIKKLDIEKKIKSLLDKSKATRLDIKRLEDQLTKLKAENNNLSSFLVKTIEQKKAELACPVCLETAEAPIFTCQQMHLICSSCQPRVSSCPVCREAYQVNTRLSLDNSDHVT